MWFLILLGIAIYHLIQTTTWTLPSYRRGIVIYKHKSLGPFISKIPKELINQEIACEDIIFKFLTPNIGLFRVDTKIRMYGSRFPTLLGEIELNPKSIARIRLRIPFSTILMLLALYIYLVLSIVKVIPIIIVTMILGIVFTIGFSKDKDELLDAVIMLMELVNAKSLVKP
jgi:hypothetical protein